MPDNNCCPAVDDLNYVFLVAQTVLELVVEHTGKDHVEVGQHHADRSEQTPLPLKMSACATSVEAFWLLARLVGVHTAASHGSVRILATFLLARKSSKGADTQPKLLYPGCWRLIADSHLVEAVEHFHAERHSRYC